MVEVPSHLTLYEFSEPSTSNHYEHNYGECRVMITKFYKITHLPHLFSLEPHFWLGKKEIVHG